jgi:hypothetical protein
MTKASKHSKAPSKEIAAPYTPTPREEAALDAFKARRMARAPSPRMKVCRKGTVAALAPDHPHRETAQTVLMESLGSADYEFVDGLLAQIGLSCKVDLGTDEYERQHFTPSSQASSTTSTSALAEPVSSATAKQISATCRIR